MVSSFRKASASTPVVKRSMPKNFTRNMMTRVSSELLAIFVDDGWLAAGTVAWVALCAIVIPVISIPAVVKAIGFAAGFTVLLFFSTARGTRAERRPQPPLSPP
jgi:hypothetical protein